MMETVSHLIDTSPTLNLYCPWCGWKVTSNDVDRENVGTYSHTDQEWVLMHKTCLRQELQELKQDGGIF